MQKLALSSLLAIALLFSACHHRKQTASTPLQIEVTEAREDSISMRYTFATHLQYNYEAVIEPRVNGYLLRKHYADGQMVRRGDLLFINYGSTHQFQAHEAFSYINICFKPEVLTQTVITPENAFAMLQLTAFDEIRRESDESMISFSGEERDEIEHLLRAMLKEYKQRPDSWRTMLESYMNILFVSILRRIRLNTVEKDEPDVWKQLFQYIDQNLGSDLTLDTLAGKCFYNPSYFSRIFKERFELSVSEYINRRRIDYAIRLFQTTDLSSERIAEQAGFSSKSSFYRVFTKVTGKSPTDFRKQK